MAGKGYGLAWSFHVTSFSVGFSGTGKTSLWLRLDNNTFLPYHQETVSQHSLAVLERSEGVDSSRKKNWKRRRDRGNNHRVLFIIVRFRAIHEKRTKSFGEALRSQV